MTDRSYDCWRQLFNLTDELREKANASNLDTSKVSDITVGQMKVLQAVASLSLDSSDGLMLKTLAEKVKLTSGAVSIIVDSLVRQGLLERRHSTADRRAVNIFLSEKGKEKVGSYIAFFNQETARFLSLLSESEQETFLALLQKFRDSVSR